MRLRFDTDGDGPLVLRRNQPPTEQGHWLVLQENGEPIGCLLEVDTDAGYVIQARPGEEPLRIEGKFRVVVNLD